MSKKRHKKVLKDHYDEGSVLIANKSFAELTVLINSLKYVEILALLEKCTDEEEVAVFENMNIYIGIKCFKILPEKSRRMLVQKMHHEKVAKLLNNLPDDDLTSFVEGLPSRVVNELLKLLSDDNRKAVLS